MDKRLKVLFVTRTYPNEKHPLETVFIREYAKAAQLYSDVVVIHIAGFSRKIKGLWHIEEEKDASLTEGVRTYRVLYRLLPLPKSGYLVSFYGFFRAFQWLVKQGFRPEVIHVHVYHIAVPAILISKAYKLPVVISEHSSAFLRKLLDWRSVLETRFTFRRAEKVLPVSKALQKNISAYGIKANFTVVPNTVNTDLFYPDPLSNSSQNSPKRLLFVGNLVPVKGMPYLLEALSLLDQNRSDWHLDILGDGTSRSEYERVARELGIEDRVVFHGYKTKSEVAEFMRRADLFVLPSVYETFGCVLIESMCSGLPIVGTTAGGIPEVVPDFCGILVPPADPQALMRAIVSVLCSDKKFDRASIVDWARKNYSYDAVGKRLLAIYKEVCNR